jgi:hypothetical protein
MFWEGEFLEALCFARQQQTERVAAATATKAGAIAGNHWSDTAGKVGIGSPVLRSTRNIPVPWIVSHASSRMISSRGSNSPYSMDLVETLKLLHGIAISVSEAVVLEPPLDDRSLRSLWRRSSDRRVDLKRTEEM